MALREDVPHARCIFIQPPGREARMGEANEADIDTYIEHVCGALRPRLVGPQAIPGDVVFIGDSWGSLAAYCVAHRLREQTGFTPDHMVISGNASPTIASEHAGLGSFSNTPIAQLSDEDLERFLKTSGVDEVGLSKKHSGGPDGAGARSAQDDGSEAIMAAMVAALRADCQLYEDFRHNKAYEPLPCNALVLRGMEDAVVSQTEMTGWADEFCGEVRRPPRRAPPAARLAARPRPRQPLPRSTRESPPLTHAARRVPPTSTCTAGGRLRQGAQGEPPHLRRAARVCLSAARAPRGRPVVARLDQPLARAQRQVVVHVDARLVQPGEHPRAALPLRQGL